MKTRITNIHPNYTALSWDGEANGREVRWYWATETWHYLDTGEQITNWEVG